MPCARDQSRRGWWSIRRRDTNQKKRPDFEKGFDPMSQAESWYGLRRRDFGSYVEAFRSRGADHSAVSAIISISCLRQDSYLRGMNIRDLISQHRYRSVRVGRLIFVKGHMRF